MVSTVERPLRVAVIGAANPSEEDYETARLLGRGLAEGGAVVICGGHGGVMEGVARGATEAGGLTIGILPGRRASTANDYIVLPIATGMGEARNALVVRSAQAVVAVGGAWGTLSEIAFAKTMGLDVGTLGRPPAEGLDLPAFSDPGEAAEWALRRARGRRNG